MKNSVKIIGLFVFLSIGFSGLSCSDSKNTQSENKPQTANGSASPATNSGGSGAANDNEFPAIPAEIMQAELKSLDGSTFKLTDYKGKTILVNFWATWCKPCEREMPELVEMQTKHKDSGFEIIGVNADENDTADAIKAFGEKKGLNYKLAQSDLDFYDQFLKISKKEGIPQSFLIDGAGRLHGAYWGASPMMVSKMKNDVAQLVGGK